MQRSAFIGRDKEIAEVIALLETDRLVTLTGVGGCGKTRLAQHVGAEVLDLYPDGVFFVDLAQLADSDVVQAAIGTAVGAPMQAEIGTALRGTTDELLFGFLAPRTCLVILDNCEHLLDAIADTADQILARAPNVTVLATSREALDVEGEQSWRVPSLSLPADGEPQTSEAVSLFKARARAVRPDFDLTPGNVDAVVEICRRLDGIPLAIEFAAARVPHLSPQEIASRLGDMFKLLAGGRRRRVQRQQTLQAALDWSYELLTDAEQRLLRRLAVFAASFPLPAAEGVCSGDGVENVLDLLGSLVAKSLVTTDEQDGKTRYRLIETVRLYATEKLREAEEADARRSRHRDWYQAWISSFSWDELLFLGPRIDEIGAEQASLRTALEWSEAEDRLDLVIGMASRVRGVWVNLGNFEDGLRWVTSARPEDVDVTAEERVASLANASFLTNVLQRQGANELADRAVAAGGDGPSAALAYAHYQRAINTAITSEWMRDSSLAAAAREEIDEAIGTAEGYPIMRRVAKLGRGLIALMLGDHATAAETYTATPPVAGEGVENASRAIAAHIVGDHDHAVVASHHVVEMIRTDLQGYAFYGAGVGAPSAALAGGGDVEEARSILLEFLDVSRRSGRPGALEELLVGAAAVLHLSSNHPSASRLLAWVRARTFDVGRILPTPSGYALYKYYVPLVRAALDPADARAYLKEGRAMSEDEAVALAREALS
jgi:predicted ATPase